MLMVKRGVILLLALFTGWLANSQNSSTSRASQLDIEAYFERGLEYKEASYTDSAKVFFLRVLEELGGKEQNRSPIVLATRLHLAEIIMREEEDFSSKELLDIIKLGKEEQEWELVAHAHVLLAMVHETLGQLEKCEHHLDQALLLINKHQVTTIYPRYAIGRSSYFRIFKISQDSALFYAQEALRTSPDQPSGARADAYFLLGSLQPESSAKKIEFLGKSADVHLQLRNYYGHAIMLVNITKQFIRQQQFAKAKIFSDSTFQILEPLSTENYDYYATTAYAAKMRVEIYKAWGQSDSAWYYNEIAHQASLTYAKRVNAKAITEVEERFVDAEKTQRLAQQAQQLEFERKRRNGAVALLLIVILSAAVLSYFYLQLRQANQKNRDQALRLANLDKAKSRFFANVSHELRTPLSLMLGPINTLLKENQLSEKQTKLLQTADRSGKQLQELVNEILDLHKLEVTALAVNTQATDLRAYFSRYFVQFESLAERKNIDYQFRIDIDARTVGHIDQEKCRQILYNLLSNAFKYTPNGGSIKAAVNLQTDVLHLSVSDTGVGIHPDDLPEVFDRYFQTNRPEKPIDGGMGIGLALCSEYVKLFDGRILAESTIGEGSTFKLSFPVSLSEEGYSAATTPLDTIHIPAVVSQEEPIVSVGNAQKSTILVVEDNLELAEYLRLILSPHYNIFSAENGQEAWYYLNKMTTEENEQTCQLILSDLMMPVMDGYQLLNLVKSSDITRHIPVVMLTARASLGDKLKALRIGVDDYLLKPFEEEELLVRINNLLHNQRVRQKATLPEHKTDTAVPLVSMEDQAWLSDFEAFVDKNLSNGLLAIPMLAENFTMSESTLLRQLKRLTGLTPNQYLKEVRLVTARRLLENRTYKSIAQVAYAVGYTDPRSFSRAFKRKYGQMPSEAS